MSNGFTSKFLLHFNVFYKLFSGWYNYQVSLTIHPISNDIFIIVLLFYYCTATTIKRISVLF